jgi:hypothetical protein
MKWTLLHPLCPCSTPVSGGLTNLALVLLPYVKTRGVCQIVALPFTLKSMYLKAKEELWKTQIFHHPKI